jgi:hypothetical protein
LKFEKCSEFYKLFKFETAGISHKKCSNKKLKKEKLEKTNQASKTGQNQKSRKEATPLRPPNWARPN